MKKTFALFLCLMICGIALLGMLPGYILKEGEQVQITEQEVVGDPSVVDGVTVTAYSHYNRRLLWDTVYTFGEEPKAETEYRFVPAGEPAYKKYRYGEEKNYINLLNRLSGGWSVSSTGGLSINSSNVTIRGMEAAFSELAALTKAGEEKTARVSLTDYMTYYPVSVVMNTEEKAHLSAEADELDIEYAEFFRIPVLEDAMYEISIEKNKKGEVVSMGGSDLGSGVFSWNSVSVRTETDFYFTFHPYASNGVRVDTSLIPGGFGIYRQPYELQGEELVADPSKVEMVYPLEEVYSQGNRYLGINAAGQLVILTDNETAICLQVVDLDTMELVQKAEYARPEGSTRFEGVRLEEDFILLNCGKGYFSLIDWEQERGYEQQFMIQLGSEDPMYWRHDLMNENAMDWDGERLVFACYSAPEQYSIQTNCNIELMVYDKTGRIYHGNYLCSLLTEQEYTGEIHGADYVWNESCEPWTKYPLEVTWP